MSKSPSPWKVLYWRIQGLLTTKVECWWTCRVAIKMIVEDERAIGTSWIGAWMEALGGWKAPRKWYRPYGV